MIAAILGWTKLPQWALELIVIAGVAGGIWFWQHHLIAEGVAQQKGADAIELQNLKVENDKKSADLQARATTAENARDKEVQDNANFRSSHPDQPVRLCLATNQGSGTVPKATGQNPGNATAGSASANVPTVHAGDSSGGPGAAGPDIGSLLGLLAEKADDVSSTLREFQSR
jgi:hypothetical protein